MRFMMLMIPKSYQSAASGSTRDYEAAGSIMKYNESLQGAGILLALDRLDSPSTATRVVFASGKPNVVEGFPADAIEAIGGYWLIQAKSKEEAVEWARRCPASDGDVIEIRQVQETTGFSPQLQAGAEER